MAKPMNYIIKCFLKARKLVPISKIKTKKTNLIIDQCSPTQITINIRTHWRIERNIKELDGRLPLKKENENSSKG